MNPVELLENFRENKLGLHCLGTILQTEEWL